MEIAPSFSSGINLQPGTLTNIVVKRTYAQNEPKPFTECDSLTSFSSELYNFFKNSGKRYRQSDCIQLCTQKIIIKNCGCYWTKYANLYTSTPPCLNLTDWYCISNQYLENESLKECLEECPLECESVSYDSQISSLEYPSIQFYYILRNDNAIYKTYVDFFNVDWSTYESFKSSFLSLNVFYPDLQYTKITSTPKFTTIDLISQIGGSLGMFVGFSLFHFIELIEILFLICYITLTSKMSLNVVQNEI